MNGGQLPTNQLCGINWGHSTLHLVHPVHMQLLVVCVYVHVCVCISIIYHVSMHHGLCACKLHIIPECLRLARLCLL